MSIELKAAPPQDVTMYTPYYKEPAKKAALPYAISLYKQGELEGQREVEGGSTIPFVASWRTSMLPVDLTVCTVIFEGNPELKYELTLENLEFVNYLIDIVTTIRDKGVADFPQIFYSRLFRIKLAAFDSI